MIFDSIGCINYSFSLDYYSKTSMVIFLIGCNLRCSYCYNWRLVFGEKIMSDDEIRNYLNKNLKFIDAIVISGGEPTIYKYEELKDLIYYFKEKKSNIKIKIDTNGSNPEILEQMILNNLIDAVGVDIKASVMNLLGFKKILPSMPEKFIMNYLSKLVSTIVMLKDYINKLDLIEFRTVKLNEDYDNEIEEIKKDLLVFNYPFDFTEKKNIYVKNIDNCMLIYRINEFIDSYGILEENLIEL